MRSHAREQIQLARLFKFQKFREQITMQAIFPQIDQRLLARKIKSRKLLQLRSGIASHFLFNQFELLFQVLRELFDQAPI